ncbi:hypothetical protein WICPIJ_006041 [Wickerhamomyces pijperi]|uniref:Uncharacterized protein n=1 Tax=Wickerhamomyces pijperi TaxID=599730 RepID=A0A9P8TL87_WICPI|nr:hypothetical protein WICPIJ_006041 [Wickerhamomyces pijperi]
MNFNTSNINGHPPRRPNQQSYHQGYNGPVPNFFSDTSKSLTHLDLFNSMNQSHNLNLNQQNDSQPINQQQFQQSPTQQNFVYSHPELQIDDDNDQNMILDFNPLEFDTQNLRPETVPSSILPSRILQQDTQALYQSQGPVKSEPQSQQQHLQNGLIQSEDEVNEIYDMFKGLPKISPDSEFSFTSNHEYNDLRMDIDERESMTLENLLDDDSLFSYGNQTGNGSVIGGGELQRQESNDTILQGSSPINGDGFKDDAILGQQLNGGHYNESVEQLSAMNRMSISSNVSIPSLGPKQSTFYTVPSASNSGLELMTPSSASAKAKPVKQVRRHSQKKASTSTGKGKSITTAKKNTVVTPESIKSDPELSTQRPISPISSTSSTKSFQPLVFPPQQPLFTIVQPPPPIKFSNSQLPLSIQLRHSQSQHTLKRDTSTPPLPSEIQTSASAASLARSRSSSVASKPIRATAPQQQRYSSLIIESPNISSSKSRTRAPSVTKASSSLSLNKVNKLNSYSPLSTNLTTSFATVKKSKSYLSKSQTCHYQTLDFSKNIKNWNNQIHSDRISSQGSAQLKSKFSLDSASSSSSYANSSSKDFQFVIEDGLKGYNDRNRNKSTNSSTISLPVSYGPLNSTGYNHTMTPSGVKYFKVNSEPSPYDHRFANKNQEIKPASSCGSLNSKSSGASTITSVKTKKKQEIPYKYQSIIYPSNSNSTTPKPAAVQIPPSQITTFRVSPASSSAATTLSSTSTTHSKRNSQISMNNNNVNQAGYESSPNTSHSPASSSTSKLIPGRDNFGNYSTTGDVVSPVSSRFIGVGSNGG